MYYVTLRQSPKFHQMSLDELLSDESFSYRDLQYAYNESDTRTYATEVVSDKLKNQIDVVKLVESLEVFNERTRGLRAEPRESLYRSFKVKKKTGGYRQIDAPLPELMEALRDLKKIFEEDFHALYHTSAFAYVKHRSCVDARKRHQANESKWFGHYDLHDFFGSTTLEFVMKQLSMVFPFSEVCKTSSSRGELRTALQLAFLNGGLPQGTPISPMLTNIMMIPIDYTIAKGMRDFNRQRFIYTRYADDIEVSSRYNFDFREIERFIQDVFKQFNAPFRLNEKKTHYGSSAGKNFSLGILINKDNELTVGHEAKRKLEAKLFSFVMDTWSGKPWDFEEIHQLEGYINYYKMVEGDTIDKIVAHVGHKLNINIPKMIKAQLKQ